MRDDLRLHRSHTFTSPIKYSIHATRVVVVAAYRATPSFIGLEVDLALGTLWKRFKLNFMGRVVVCFLLLWVLFEVGRGGVHFHFGVEDGEF